MLDVKTRRVMLGNDHDDQKWFVYEGYVEGVPSVTKRVTIAVAALVSRPELLEQARAKLIEDVTEYHGNYVALQAL